jgi:hypothetical protein
MIKATTRAKKYGLETMTFDELGRLKDFAIVFTGAGDPLDEWRPGLEKILVEEKLAHAPVFSRACVLTGNVREHTGDYRTDLVLIFDKKSQVDVGRLAMWRLRTGGYIKWVEDFLVNYAEDYDVALDEETEDDDA